MIQVGNANAAAKHIANHEGPIGEAGTDTMTAPDAELMNSFDEAACLARNDLLDNLVAPGPNGPP